MQVNAHRLVALEVEGDRLEVLAAERDHPLLIVDPGALGSRLRETGVVLEERFDVACSLRLLVPAVVGAHGLLESGISRDRDPEGLRRSTRSEVWDHHEHERSDRYRGDRDGYPLARPEPSEDLHQMQSVIGSLRGQRSASDGPTT